MVAQGVDGAEAGASGYGGHRLVGGLQVVFGQQDALAGQPLEWGGPDFLVEASGEGPWRQVCITGMAWPSTGDLVKTSGKAGQRACD